MSKTYKDKEIYARFQHRDEILYKQVQEQAEIMTLHGTGLRHGNHRRWKADMKSNDRRAQRAKEKQEFLRDDYDQTE